MIDNNGSMFVGASPAACQSHGQWPSGIAGVLPTGGGTPPQGAPDRRTPHPGNRPQKQ